MEYLVAWRRAVAKGLLRRQELGLTEIAERVGYGSASAFSIAFSRHVGQPPSRYARLLPSVVAGGDVVGMGLVRVPDERRVS